MGKVLLDWDLYSLPEAWENTHDMLCSLELSGLWSENGESETQMSNQ